MKLYVEMPAIDIDEVSIGSYRWIDTSNIEPGCIIRNVAGESGGVFRVEIERLDGNSPKVPRNATWSGNKQEAESKWGKPL